MTARDDVVLALDQIDVLERALRRVDVGGRNGVAVRDAEQALFLVRRHVADALSALPESLDPRCTGVAASWCPVHGTCTCPRRGDGEPIYRKHEEGVVHDDACPLHGVASNHCESAIANMRERTRR